MKPRFRSAPVAALIILLLSYVGYALDSDASDPDPPPPANTPVGGMMYRACLDAEALATAGIASEDVDDVVGAANSKWQEVGVALSTADEEYRSSKVQHDRLARIVRSGQATPEEVGQCQTAKQSCESAQANRSALVDQIFASGVSSLDPADRDKLEALRTNYEWFLPRPYMVVLRTESEWVELREALDTRKIHFKYGAAFPQETQTYLAGIESDPTVSAALVDLDTYLAAVQTAWNQAVTE